MMELKMMTIGSWTKDDRAFQLSITLMVVLQDSRRIQVPGYHDDLYNTSLGIDREKAVYIFLFILNSDGRVK